MKLFFSYLILINLIGLMIMHSDKKRAIKGKYRIAESTLWFITLVGGALGTTIGMNLYRHKTKHFAFKYGFPLIMILQIAALVYFSFFIHLKI